MGKIPKYIYDGLRAKGEEKVDRKINELIEPFNSELQATYNDLLEKHRKDYLDYINKNIDGKVDTSVRYNNWSKRTDIYININGLYICDIGDYSPLRKEWKVIKYKYEDKIKKISNRVRDKFDDWLLNLWQNGTTDANVSLPSFDNIDISDIIDE